MGAIMCTFVHPKSVKDDCGSRKALQERIEALEKQQLEAKRLAEDARLDGLLNHGNQMLAMMNEFKSIMDASLLIRRADSMDGTGPCRLPATTTPTPTPTPTR